MGDFQTPKSLTDKICSFLYNNGCSPTILLEPSCGIGNFVLSALKYFPDLKYIYSIEIQEKYVSQFKINIANFLEKNDNKIKINIFHDNFFKHKFRQKFLEILSNGNEKLLILGNPPWITNSELSVMNSSNLPKKRNIKKFEGINALTGASNFDIAEYFIYALIKRFSFREGKIAILCKTIVPRNIIKDKGKLGIKISNMRIYTIDSLKEFSISADACLFIADFGKKTENICQIYSFYNPKNRIKSIGWIGTNFVSDIEKYKELECLEGNSTFVWRQGVKHDAKKIFILKKIDGYFYVNGYNEKFELENDLLYPFLKGSELRNYVAKPNNTYIIITQKELGQDTSYIKKEFPKIWNYLELYKDRLRKRKSKIYDNKPPFSIFGIGNYSFKPYKIGIAGFYKEPIFSLILPVDGKPVMLDDTCYQISFDNLKDAFFTWIIYNSKQVKEFLLSITFTDSKRPFTKRNLMRVNISSLLKNLDFNEIKEFYDKQLKKYFIYEFSESDFNEYKNRYNFI